MNRIYLDGGGYLLLALGLLTLPLRWFFAALAAAAFHEACHWVAAHLMGARIRRLRLGAAGGTMVISVLSVSQEAVCALAGPVGSFLLVPFYSVYPELSLVALGQGLFNLLPVYPMDGGRVLKCLAGEKAANIVANVVLTVLFCLIFFLLVREDWFGMVFLAAVFLRIGTRKRKSSCKDSNPSLQ